MNILGDILSGLGINSSDSGKDSLDLGPLNGVMDAFLNVNNDVTQFGSQFLNPQTLMTFAYFL